MNERIRELMLEVGFVGYGEDLGSYNIPVPAFNSRMEKFAELIVRECVKVMYDNAIERKVPPDINQTPTHYAIAVLEHFGVE